jgi:hypothetical protein
MAEELFQFLLKLKEDGVDLSEVDVWFDEFPDPSDLNGFLGLVDLFSYDPEDKEITLTEK